MLITKTSKYVTVRKNAIFKYYNLYFEKATCHSQISLRLQAENYEFAFST